MLFKALMLEGSCLANMLQDRDTYLSFGMAEVDISPGSCCDPEHLKQFRSSFLSGQRHPTSPRDEKLEQVTLTAVYHIQNCILTTPISRHLCTSGSRSPACGSIGSTYSCLASSLSWIKPSKSANEETCQVI